MENIRNGIFIHVWLNGVMGKKSKLIMKEGTSLRMKGKTWVVFHENAPVETNVTFDREDPGENTLLAREVANASNWAIKNLLKGKEDMTEKANKEVHKMQESADKLEVMLNPLVLRPMILSTRCDICPI